MRFYVPEWDDAVDANYDFEYDELSVINRQERELSYIWDIFKPSETPIDGVLISREQAEETNRRAARITEHGVYDDPVLSVPRWLPTISDCGAWGYKSLPFPPYSNAGMLEFYDKIDVSIGVTIDHLVLGSGKERGRLYLDERAFHDEFRKSDIPKRITETVDLMIDEWPSEWPSYVSEYEKSIYTNATENINTFTPEDFSGDAETALNRLSNDSRAVYRQNDKQFRYKLTLRNARKMRALYQEGDYPFRLMVAIQGWTSKSYVNAASTALELGYDYIGIGGVAGSPVHEVRKIVKDIGKRVKKYERDQKTRVDSHVFGFAKSEAFETIGRSGISSFDSASMLRSAWTGGRNYRLDANQRYDAVRVRYPAHGADIDDAIRTGLQSREMLEALRGYAAKESILERLQDWESAAEATLTETREYLKQHRHDEKFNRSILRDIKVNLRNDFDDARRLKGYFSGELRDRLIKLLRADDSEDPIEFKEYTDLLDIAEEQFESFPRMSNILKQSDQRLETLTRYDRMWMLLEKYADEMDDNDLLESYRRTLSDRPWEQCNCPICEDHGIEVCIFRGNDRNRRRGFHNTDRFYNEFADALPKIFVVTKATAPLSDYKTVESFLREEKSEFWEAVHDLPVAEIGVVDMNGVYEWWEASPRNVSLAADKPIRNLREAFIQHDQVYVYDNDNDNSENGITRALQETVGQVIINSQSAELRQRVLASLGESYSIGEDFAPHEPVINTNTDDGINILIIDQCSGSKYTPEGMREFDIDEVDKYSKEDLLERENIHSVAACDLYTGRQQEQITSAVRRLRSDGHSVQRYFISAGFGLIAENELLPPYEVTFSNMTVQQIRDRSKMLNIKHDVSKILTQSEYDVVFFSLGKDYYNSINIDQMVQRVQPDQIGVVFNRDIVNDQYDNIVSVPARTDDAKRHGTIVVGLKGLYLDNFAQNLSSADEIDPKTVRTLCRYTEDEAVQAGIENF